MVLTHLLKKVFQRWINKVKAKSVPFTRDESKQNNHLERYRKRYKCK